MIVQFHQNFEKQFKKFSPALRAKTQATIAKFIRNPNDPRLRNHALKGALTGKRAFWVTGDVRVIFEVYGDYVLVILLAVGTHSQMYR